ncbi:MULTISPECIES: VOC family protein [unclassified Nocardioides]|uniref:VOC family protein n=1 Tax=unclassified Nocardioides TaxID=2615069 RepID=UPI0030151812
MYFENIVFDALDPHRLGGFWEAVVGGVRITDAPEGIETTLAVPDGPELDLCFQRVPEPATASPRVHLDVAGGPDPTAEVERLLALGAHRLDDTTLADPEGSPLRVVAAGPSYDRASPLAAIRLESADPDRDTAFWSWLTGWTPGPGAPHALRHPSGRGPLLALVVEAAPKGAAKNRRHLDLRLEQGDDTVAAELIARGGHELVVEWGDLPWRSYTDPSGNELCLLPARS